jgi:hypothetical protein
MMHWMIKATDLRAFTSPTDPETPLCRSRYILYNGQSKSAGTGAPPKQEKLESNKTMVAFSLFAIPFVCKPILSWSINATAQISESTFLSSLIGTILLFALPITPLGLISPFAFRLMTKDIGNSGHISVQAFMNTMKQVFPNVYTFNIPNSINTEIMATKEPTSITTFQQNLARFSPTSTLGQVANGALPVVQEDHADGGLVFTNDRSPIEQITDQLLVNYIQQSR